MTSGSCRSTWTGVDLWLLDAVEVVSPRIIVIEYAAIFGRHASVTVPYDPNFAWSRAHWPMTYHGASLRALLNVAEKKGYTFSVARVTASMPSSSAPTCSERG